MDLFILCAFVLFTLFQFVIMVLFRKNTNKTKLYLRDNKSNLTSLY